MLVKPAYMCLVAQVVGAPVQCSEGCEKHNLAFCMPAYLSVHLPLAACLPVSVLCSFDFLWACFARLSSSSGVKGA